MSETNDTTYDALPYDGQAFAQTHPDHTAAIARFFGADPPPVETARILELGCANGENLIPMACQLPEATFVGMDLSARQVAKAQGVADQLRLRNITLRAADIMRIDDSWGTFDYILCHGVYSWVPEFVRKKILEVYRRHLSPQGVGFISYNCYPGWHERMTVRDMLLFHTAQFEEPAERVAQARSYLKFLAGALLNKESSLARLLPEMVTFFDQVSDSYLFHEFLEPINQPFHFHEFARQLGEHELEYLADHQFGSGIPQDLAPHVEQTLQQITPNWTAWEQHLDFLRNRVFRQSLIVHKGVPVSRRPVMESFDRLLIASTQRPMATAEKPMAEDDPRLFSAEPVEFAESAWTGAQFRRRVRMTTGDPLLKCALVELAERWPLPMKLAALTEAVKARAAGQVAAAVVGQLSNPARLAFPLMQCAVGEIIELHTTLPRVTMAVSERPEISAYARWQAAEARAARRGPSPSITTMRHRQVNPPPEVPWELLALADGTRTVSQLAEALTVPGSGAIEAMAAKLPAALRWAAKNALLVR